MADYSNDRGNPRPTSDTRPNVDHSTTIRNTPVRTVSSGVGGTGMALVVLAVFTVIAIMWAVFSSGRSDDGVIDTPAATTTAPATTAPDTTAPATTAPADAPAAMDGTAGEPAAEPVAPATEPVAPATDAPAAAPADDVPPPVQGTADPANAPPAP